MQTPAKGGSGGSYNSNSYQELKSHSSVLFNEQLNILLYMLNMRSMEMNMSWKYKDIVGVKTITYQIYKNIRCLPRYNQIVRYKLDMETKAEGVYVPDVVFNMVDEMIEYCNTYGWTYYKTKSIVMHLNNMELMIRDILQFFSYFMRPDFKQKPDLGDAAAKYKSMSNRVSVEKLKSIVGKRHNVDFERLDNSVQEQQDTIEMLEGTQDNPEDIESPEEIED